MKKQESSCLVYTLLITMMWTILSGCIVEPEPPQEPELGGDYYANAWIAETNNINGGFIGLRLFEVCDTLKSSCTIESIQNNYSEPEWGVQFDIDSLGISKGLIGVYFNPLSDFGAPVPPNVNDSTVIMINMADSVIVTQFEVGPDEPFIQPVVKTCSSSDPVVCEYYPNLIRKEYYRRTPLLSDDVSNISELRFKIYYGDKIIFDFSYVDN